MLAVLAAISGVGLYAAHYMDVHGHHVDVHEGEDRVAEGGVGGEAGVAKPLEILDKGEGRCRR